MTAAQGDSRELTLAGLDRRLDELTDLFRRRLTDDRTKAAMLEDLRARADFAERGLEAETILPLAVAMIRLVDRIEAYKRGGNNDAGFVESVAGEIVDALETVGVTEVAYGELDPRVHRVVRLEDSCDDGPVAVLEVARRGFVRNERVVRTADVVAGRVLVAPGIEEP